jgi:hypothetical protein
MLPALKVPRQCPFALLVEERLREGNALGSEKGKGLEYGHFYEQRRGIKPGLYCI